MPWETSETPSYEAWEYDGNYICFNRNSGYYHHPRQGFPQQGDITEAMHSETFKDPLPRLNQANYGVDFKGPGGKLEVEVVL